MLKQEFVQVRNWQSRWGWQFDDLRNEVADLRAQFLISSNHTEEVRTEMAAMAEKQEAALEGVVGVLQELKASIQSDREANQRRHEQEDERHRALMTAVSNAQMVSGQAVTNAYQAASEADQAHKAAERSAGSMSKMTKLVLVSGGVAFAALSSTVTLLAARYGWPAIWAVLDRVMGKAP